MIVSLSDFGINFCALILLVGIYVVQNYVLSSLRLEPDHLISWYSNYRDSKSL